jgi:uncharacterized lipoprotein YddW (UPF0748 family)
MLSPRQRLSAAGVILAAAAVALLSTKLPYGSGPEEIPAFTITQPELPKLPSAAVPSPSPLELARPVEPTVPDEALKLELFRPSEITPPALAREFRAAWIASVGNIDWPSKQGLSPEAQKAELIRLLAHAAGLKLNAVVLQVRPASDALYASKIEPWSMYLTGKMGKAPAPYYDPLEFAVAEAHKRGLELHAWFNPFRALSTKRHAAAAAPNHVTKTHPHLVRNYGDLVWLDPGEPDARKYVLEVIADVVKRYDIDAIHLDDYFYPYKVKGRDFPDNPSWDKYRSSGGTMARADWRRDNVDTFVRDLYSRVKQEKTWVKVGISPFGIWRPQKDLSIAGLDSFQELYADSRKWLQSGWVDYISPQLYWASDAPRQNYTTLLKWWSETNKMHRHLWPGIATARIGKERPASDILNQISITRNASESAGNIHWHFKSLVENFGKVSDELTKTLYAEPALIPAFSWLSSDKLDKPGVSFEAMRLSWSLKDKALARQWAVQTKRNGKWTMEVLPGTETSRIFKPDDLPEAIAITAIDKVGNASPAVVIERDELKDTVAVADSANMPQSL